jgi:hypothetical protein
MLFKCHSRHFGALIGRSRYRSQALDANGTGGCQNDRFSIEAGACCVFISELEPDGTVGRKSRRRATWPAHIRMKHDNLQHNLDLQPSQRTRAK